MMKLLKRQRSYSVKSRGRRTWAKRAGAAMLAVGLVASVIILNLAKPAHASAAISLQGTPTTNASGASAVGSLAVNKPTGVVSGSVMIAHVAFDSSSPQTPVITLPSGWVQAGSQISNGRWYGDVYYKVAGGSEPTSYTWSFSKNVFIEIGIASYANVDNSSPIDDIAGQSDGTNQTTQTTPSITPTTNGDMLLGFWGYRSATSATSFTGTMTQLWSTSTTNVGMSGAQELLVNAGATGTRSATTPANATALAFAVALLPAQRAPGVVFVGSSTPSSCTSCNSQSNAIPSNTQPGDMLLTTVFWSNTSILGSSVNVPSGWTQIGTTLTDGGGLFSTGYAQAEFYHFYLSTDPSSYTWGTTTTGPMIVNTADFGGVDASNPIDAQQTLLDSASTQNHNAPSITTTNYNDVYVGIWGFEGQDTANSYTVTLNQMWTNDDGANIGVAGAYEPLGAPGSTGTRLAHTVDNRGRNVSTKALMHSIALKPFYPTPKLVAPANGVDDQKIASLIFQMKNYELSAGTVQFKFDLCTNSTCTSILTTIDQTASQSGWSGQDAGGGTAYTAGTSYNTSTLATYTLSSTTLTANTQYWWRAYSRDPSLGFWTPPSSISTFTTSRVPDAPFLIFPQPSATGVPIQPEFHLSSTDADGDPVQFKIDICANSTCTGGGAILHTFDETSSQSGWSGQDSDSFTAYATDTSDPTQSTVAFFQYPFNDLSPTGTYYWRAYCIDPDGTNTWSVSSEIRPFTAATYNVRILNGVIKSGVIQ